MNKFGTGFTYADDPILSIDQDVLDRDEFFAYAARVINQTADHQKSAVIGLIGSWGSGKSSALRVIRTAMESNETWVFVEYNPWLFSDLDAMLLGFFECLAEGLEIATGGGREKVASFLEGVAAFSKIGGVFGIDPSAAIEKIADKVRDRKTLDMMRANIEDEIRESGKRILVIVDDLDRLHPDELLLMFKLFRLVGRFEGVYYVVSYDERTLVDLLKATDLVRENARRANDYMEKIVQVRLDLPPLHDEQARETFYGYLSSIVDKYRVPLTEIERDRVNYAFDRCLIGRLRTPRSVKRFFVQADAFFGNLINEVDFVDFLLVTFIRTYEPLLYLKISSMRNELTELGQNGPSLVRELFSSVNDEEASPLAEGLEELEIGADQVAPIARLLALLFLPCRQLATEAYSPVSTNFDDIKERQGIGHSFYFDRYFQYRVPQYDISDRMIQASLDMLFSSGRPISPRIQDALESKPLPVLSKLRQYARIMDGEYFLSFVDVLLHHHGREGHLRSFSEATPDELIELMVAELLDRLDNEKQSSVVEYIGKAGKWRVLSAVVSRGLRDKVKTHEWAQYHKEYAANLVETVGSELSITDLDSMSYDEFSVLRYWYELGDKARLKTFVMGKIESKEWQVESFLGLLAGRNYVYGRKGGRYVIGQLTVELIQAYAGFDLCYSLMDFGLSDDLPPIDSFEDMEPTVITRKLYARSFMKFAYIGGAS